MTYNLTSISSNTTGLLTLTQNVNSILLYDLWGILMLIMIGAISFMSFYFSNGNVPKSLTATSFIIVTLALLLRMVSLIPDLAFFITVILCAGMVAVSVNKD